MKYTLLPGILPRAKDLFASGFGYVAFLMASIYGSVRLLPPGHPYLLPENIGRFGIRHVIAEAANHLVFNKKNIDQIIIFMTMLAGLVILVLQFLLLVYAYVIEPAMAQSNFTGSIFETPNPANDIAFLLLDKVFGVPNLSCNTTGACSVIEATLPLPFHVALHSMLKFYSIGMLLIGVIIFLYFILVVVAETATTGSPFGQRFQNAWVPIRLVVALGLLVPINYGLNSGQYIALYAAKLGSGMATNGWIRFNETLGSSMGTAANPSGESESLLAWPTPPSISPVADAVSLVHACAYAHWKMEAHWQWDRANNGGWNPSTGNKDNDFLINSEPTYPGRQNSQIKPYFVKNVFPLLNKNTDTYQEVTPNTTYLDALDFYDNSDIVIRFGRRFTDVPQPEGPPTPALVNEFDRYRGGVEPTCGEIRIPVFDLAHIGQGDTLGGADQIQDFQFKLIRQLWFNVDQSTLIDGYPIPSLARTTHQFVEVSLGSAPDLSCALGLCNPTDIKPELVGKEDRATLLGLYQPAFNNQVITAWDRFNKNATDSQLSQDILDRGWGGAGIWYNKIAEMNGVFVSSVINLPSMVKYPDIMEKVQKEKRADDRYSGTLDAFEPTKATNSSFNITDEDRQIARALSDFYTALNGDGGPDQSQLDKTLESNALKNIMNMIFGTNGLFDMQNKNAYIHPLSQLTAVGKSLVDSTIRNIAISSAAAMGGPVAASLGFNGVGGLSALFGDFLIKTAFVGVTAGFVLFYVLPFLPFVYFYFAVGSWVKTIFEAMVGVPLWALAHLRIDGEGLPGDSATSGYFLIFEIFLRPILTVFGLIASLLIFTAQVRVLNFLWSLVVENLTGAGADPTTQSAILNLSIDRGIVDEFFYTIIYTIIVYMLAIASFKLIDRIPDNLLRWMNAGVSSFSDINQDPVEQLNRYAALGGLTVGQKAAGSIKELAGGIGQAGGQGMSSLNKIIGPTKPGL